MFTIDLTPQKNLLRASSIMGLLAGNWWDNPHRKTRSKSGGGVAQQLRRLPRRYISEREQIIKSMTNRQRNQAGKACKGKWSRLTIDKLEKFAAMPHWKEAR